MSEKEIAAPVPTAVELKQEELTFGVDEAVNVLSTMYETKRSVILDREREVLDTIVEARDDLVNELKDAIDVSEYNHVSETLGITSRVKDTEIRIGKTIEDSNIRVILMLTDTDISGSNYTPEFGKYRNLPINEETYTAVKSANDGVDVARKAHSKSVSKLDNLHTIRERLHAKVMSVKLKDAGLANVLEDADILAIIEI